MQWRSLRIGNVPTRRLEPRKDKSEGRTAVQCLPRLCHACMCGCGCIPTLGEENKIGNKTRSSES
eukprot:8439682-Prorocentrum_lima.AAC.1